MKFRFVPGWLFLLLAAATLSGCANPAYPDLPLAEVPATPQETRVVVVQFDADSTSMDAESAAQLSVLNALAGADGGGKVLATFGSLDQPRYSGRRQAIALRFSHAIVQLTEPAPGLDSDSVIVTYSPGPSRQLSCAAAISPRPGQTLGFIAPDCKVVTALNMNVADQADLETGVRPEPGLLPIPLQQGRPQRPGRQRPVANSSRSSRGYRGSAP